MTITPPSKITVPFANGAGSGYKNTIPVASQIGITNGAASYTDGFPPLTMTPVGSGGVPPFGQDVNGILYALSQAIQFSQSGGVYIYDSAFQTAVGGYPQGSIVMASDYSGFWLNTVANNATNPEAGGAGWIPYYQYGNTTKSLSSLNITLTGLEAAKNALTLSGVITANIVITMPTYIRTWNVYNNTTGAYTITVKYATGAGVVLAAGANVLFGDGSNIYNALPSFDASIYETIAHAAATYQPKLGFTPVQQGGGAGQYSNKVYIGWDNVSKLKVQVDADDQGYIWTQNLSASNFSTTGYQKFPSGLIMQWGVVVLANGPSQLVTLPMTFPNAGINAVCSYGAIPLGSNSCGASIADNSHIFIGNSNSGGTNQIWFIALGY